MKPPTKNTIGIFGGAFDPIHYGHLKPIATIMRQQNLSKIIYVPTGQSATRKIIAPAAHRLKMIQIAIGEYKNFTVSDIELNRLGNSYTIDTITELQTQNPDKKFVLLLGSDAFANFDNWHRAVELKKIIKIITVPRYNDSPTADISATKIRAAVGADQPAGEMLPPQVAEYINHHNLYKC